MPDISIIIPIYNVADYITRCYTSVADVYPSREIIFVDDGSTDNSGAIIDDISKKDNRVKVIHKVNGGLSSARNAGLEIAQGEYILFIDSDDYIESSMPLYMHEMAKSKSSDMVVVNAWVEFEEDKNKYPYLSLENKDYLIDADRKQFIVKQYLNAKLGYCVWNKLYKRSIIEENGLRFFDNNVVHSEDIPFNTIYFTFCSKVSTSNDLFYHYIQRGNSITHQALKNAPKIMLKTVRLAEFLYEYSTNSEHKEAKVLEDISFIAFFRGWLSQIGSAIYDTKELQKSFREFKKMEFSHQILKRANKLNDFLMLVAGIDIPKHKKNKLWIILKLIRHNKYRSAVNFACVTSPRFMKAKLLKRIQ